VARTIQLICPICAYYRLCTPPDWFVDAIDLSQVDAFVVIDDDRSIHEVWSQRLSTLKGVEMISFLSIKEFKKWFPKKRSGSFRYFVDYEFINEDQDGIALIEEMGIGALSILVTSQYDSGQVIDACDRVGLKQIPKILTGYVKLKCHGVD
jgi:DNA-binding NtrC family response regulator